jgi:hypothetical protein
MTGTLHEDLCTFMLISRWILLRRNISGKSCRENQNTHFMFNNCFFWKSCHLSDNVEKYDTAEQATDDNVNRHMHIACWITKATDTHSEYVILFAFLQQQSYYEWTSMLHLYVHCLSVHELTYWEKRPI